MIKRWLQNILGGTQSSTACPGEFPIPWETGRKSIYRFLAEFETPPSQALPEAAQTLPDEEAVNKRSGSQLRWAPGAMDGALGHHAGGSSDANGTELHIALLTAAKEPSAGNIKSLYNMLVEDSALGSIDPLLRSIRSTPDVPIGQLRALARWLATESPDRGAVKIGIALLGLLLPAEDTDTLVTLGLHEEFTLYSVVALGCTLDDSQVHAAWWSLAKRLHGWGRIHIVERLVETQDEEIRHWLLREGYKNSVMYEYLAYSCAVGGNLLGALQSGKIDDALLVGAGEIIEALINGGPAEDIYFYADGAKAVPLYLQVAERANIRDLKALIAVARIQSFATDGDADWERLAELGWTEEVRAQLVAACERFIALEYWPRVVEDSWSSRDDQNFWIAARAGEILGLEVWAKRFERQRLKLSEQWYFLMRTDDPARVQSVIDLLMDQFDLAAIATGPAEEMGLGPGNENHSALGAVLQDLGRFPGMGFPLIQAGLRSPVIRNRNLAARALKSWGVSNWPSGTREMLQQALDAEPNSDTRALLAETSEVGDQ